MKITPQMLILKGQKGIVLPLVAILMFVFIGFAAFAIDFGHLYVVRNQLQNAADAAALAGASVLFENPSIIDADIVNSTAEAVAEMNYSGGKQVPVPVIEIGHYSFPSTWAAPGAFSPAQSFEQMTGWQDLNFSTLNTRTEFINAVRATVSRSDVPRFFSKIFDSSPLNMNVKAIAYVGFAGTISPHEFDQPIAMCKDALISTGNFECGVGRMINSGNNQNGETAGWTNFTQGPCETTTGNDVNTLVCGDGNPDTLHYGEEMGSTGGQKPFGALYKCWQQNSSLEIIDGYPTQPWDMTLAVIECPGNNVAPCSKLVGAVEISVVWINDQIPASENNRYNDAPKKMADWENNSLDGKVRWDSFVAHFGLWDVLNNRAATYEATTIYFRPECKIHEPVGKTGGENYGILAKHPVLVK